MPGTSLKLAKPTYGLHLVAKLGRSMQRPYKRPLGHAKAPPYKTKSPDRVGAQCSTKTVIPTGRGAVKDEIENSKFPSMRDSR